MKKQFLNLGRALNKAEQKSINGSGSVFECRRATNEQECREADGVWYSCAPEFGCYCELHFPPC